MVMTREEIRSTFEQLAMSQGSYGRLLRAIDESEDDLLGSLEQIGFNNPVELIMYVEG